MPLGVFSSVWISTMSDSGFLAPDDLQDRKLPDADDENARRPAGQLGGGPIGVRQRTYTCLQRPHILRRRM
jgi:hypothetical protein